MKEKIEKGITVFLGEHKEMTGEQKVFLALRTLIWALLPLMLYLFLPGILMIFGMFFRGWKKDTASFINGSGNFYNTAGVLLCFLIMKKRARKRGADFSDEATLYLVPVTRDFLKKAGIYAVLGISLNVFLSAVLTLLPLGNLISAYQASSQKVFYRTDLLLALLSVFIIAPLSEETAIRGYMLNRLMTFYPEKTAVYLSSLVFALCHVNPIWVIYAFFMGVLLAKISLKEDNILYSVIVHASFNLPSVVNILIRQENWSEQLFFGNKILVFFYGLLAFLILVVWYQKNREVLE